MNGINKNKFTLKNTNKHVTIMYGENKEAPLDKKVTMTIHEGKPFNVWIKPGAVLPPEIKMDIHFTFISNTSPDEDDLGQLHLKRSHGKPPHGDTNIPVWTIRWSGDTGNSGHRYGVRPTTNVTITEPDEQEIP